VLLFREPGKAAIRNLIREKSVQRAPQVRYRNLQTDITLDRSIPKARQATQTQRTEGMWRGVSCT